ncbi:GNAT family N-acetyltransferase [soil metagenome]
MISLRALTPADVEAVIALALSALAEIGLERNAASVQRDLEDVDRAYAAPRGGFWVAETDGVIVGSVAVRPKEGQTAELKRLYVSAAARGRGLGQTLYEHAEAFARSAGYTKIGLDSSRRFVSARRLSERNGFVVTAELDNEWEDDVYEKMLDGG